MSLLSCFVFEEKAEDTGRLREELAGPLRQMQDMARKIAKACIECKMQLDEEEYVQVIISLMWMLFVRIVRVSFLLFFCF